MSEPRPPQPMTPHLVKVIIEGVVMANNPTHATKLLETGVTTPLCLTKVTSTIEVKDGPYEDSD